MVRSHARRSGISSVDDLESESVSTDEIDNEVRIASDENTVSEANNTLSSLGPNEFGVLTGEYTVSGEAIIIPSGATVVNQARLVQADSTAGDNVHVVQNESVYSDNERDEDIKFINYGVIDGNVQNQDLSNDFRDAIKFKHIDRLEFHNIHVIDPFDWSMNVNDCNNVQFSGFTCQTGVHDSNQDGLHFVDCQDVEGHGVRGQSEDDLLAISAKDRDVVGVTITGVEGESANANLVKLNQSQSSIDAGETRFLQEITIKNAVCRSAGTQGLALGPAGANTYFENVHVELSVGESGEEGVSAEGHHRNCTYEIHSRNAGRFGWGYQNVQSAVGCEFSGSVKNPLDASHAADMENIKSSQINLKVLRDTSDSNKAALRLTSCEKTDVSLIADGGATGLFCVTGNSDIDASINSSNLTQVDYDESDGTNERMSINISKDPSNISTLPEGSTTQINGVGAESANAEEPQENWPDGTLVDFTDSGDGSGTGTYQIVNGSPVQID